MKKIFSILLCLGSGIGWAQISDMQTFCNKPPFVGGKTAVILPNVLIAQDMTGSMDYWAFHYWGETYSASKKYGGYADSLGIYDTIRVAGTTKYYFKKKTGGRFSGNKINYAYATRMDCARKVFTGGKGPAYNRKDTLYFSKESKQTGYGFDNKTMYGIITTTPEEISKGILREIGDLDTNYIWDDNAPRFALQTFSTEPRFYQKISCPFGSTLISMLDSLDKMVPDGGTPVGNAIFEGLHYLRFCSPHWTSRTPYTWHEGLVGTPSDPWYEVYMGDTVSVSCRPTYYILSGDGGSNSDDKMRWSDCSHLPHTPSPYGSGHNNFWNFDYDYDYASAPNYGTDPYDDCQSTGINHDRPADDYAYFAHVCDLRPDNEPIYGIPDKQNVVFYSIYLFAKGNDDNADSILFRKIAKHGGFVDLNGNLQPDLVPEYDNNSDGRPDNFFYADNTAQLEEALRLIFINIETLARVTSGTAAAITSPGQKSAGFAYQAQFYPKRLAHQDSTRYLEWIGNVQCLWLDPYGYLREETVRDGKLHLINDYLVMVYFDEISDRTLARLYKDSLGTGNDSLFRFIKETAVESLSYVWDAASLLRSRSYDTTGRVIYVNKHKLSGGNIVNFWPSKFWPADTTIYRAMCIEPYVPFSSFKRTYADSVIYYARGLDYPTLPKAWRNRRWQGQVWKLADIIHSSPVLSAEPQEGYDLIFGDQSYHAFHNQYRNRRPIVIAGGNDGMIHVFNAGKFVDLDDSVEIGQIDSMGKPLGSEIYALVPKRCLPYLKYLREVSYCHTYFNDLECYVADVQTFDTNSIHPYGWGTVAITGMRLGGLKTNNTLNDTFSSAYTIIDITDPDVLVPPSQVVKYELSFSNLGFTLCVPTLVKVKDRTSGAVKWYLLFGTGPLTKAGESTQVAKIYAVDMKTGAYTSINLPSPSDSNTMITNIFGVDYGLKYSVNLIYFTTVDNSGDSRIYRLMTHGSINTAKWTLHRVINVPGRPITAEGTVTTDELGDLWVFFGSGRYLADKDVPDSTIEVFLGIRDDTTRGSTTSAAFTFSDLVNVSDIEVYGDSVTQYVTWDSLVNAIQAKRGWYRNFDSIPGERVIAPPALIGGTLIFTTFIPKDTMGVLEVPDLCLGGGGGTQKGNIWALYYLTGTAYRVSILGSAIPHSTHIKIAGDMPSKPLVYIGAETEKLFIQTAGGLVGVEAPLVYDPRGAIMMWRGR